MPAPPAGIEATGSGRPLVECLAPEDWNTSVANHHYWIYDIKHKTASLLKRELEDDPVWTAFATRANQMKRQVYQTELAFCNPPQQRGKARYMSVDKLVAWGVKVLQWLDEPRPTGRSVVSR